MDTQPQPITTEDRAFDALSRFLVYHKANGCSEHTLRAYRSDLLPLVDYSGNCPASEVTADLISEWLASDSVTQGARGPRGVSTVNRVKSSVRSLGRWLLATGVCERNPAALVRMQRITQTSPVTLTEPETKRMAKELRARKGEPAARDLVMLELLLGTGIRRSELLGLDIGDIDLDSKKISIHAKGGTVETRFINQDCRRLLRKHLRNRAKVNADTPALFLSSYRRRLSESGLVLRFAQWLEWAGITRPGLSIHSLRHTFGTRLYASTHDIQLVARAMGHRSIETTQIYVHTSEEEVEAALEDL